MSERAKSGSCCGRGRSRGARRASARSARPRGCACCGSARSSRARTRSSPSCSMSTRARCSTTCARSCRPGSSPPSPTAPARRARARFRIARPASRGAPRCRADRSCWSRRSCSRSRDSPPDDVDTTWLGLKLNDEHKDELEQRLYDARSTSSRSAAPIADGQTVLAVHRPAPRPQPARGARAEQARASQRSRRLAFRGPARIRGSS